MRSKPILGITLSRLGNRLAALFSNSLRLAIHLLSAQTLEHKPYGKFAGNSHKAQQPNSNHQSLHCVGYGHSQEPYWLSLELDGSGVEKHSRFGTELRLTVQRTTRQGKIGPADSHPFRRVLLIKLLDFGLEFLL
jgi:hypothetical protein